MTQVDASTPDKSLQSERRWFQCNLRTLLIFTAAVLAAWLALWSNSARRQREAVAALRSSGAFILYGDEPYVYSFAPSSKRLLHWPTWFVNALGIDYFKGIYSVSSCEMYVNCKNKITDDALKPVKDLPTLRSLSLEGSHVTDAGLDFLESLPVLEDLYLGHTAITDAALAHVAGRTALKTFEANDTKVTDQGISQLRKQTKLQRLYLRLLHFLGC